MLYVNATEESIAGTEYDIGGFYELPRHEDGTLMSYAEVIGAYFSLSEEERDGFPLIDEETCDISFGAEPIIWKMNWDKYISENANY